MLPKSTPAASLPHIGKGRHILLRFKSVADTYLQGNRAKWIEFTLCSESPLGILYTISERGIDDAS